MAKMTSGMRLLAMTKAAREGNRADGNYNRMGDNRMTYSRMDDSMEMRRRRDSRGRYMEAPDMGYHIPPYLDDTSMRKMTEKSDGQNPYGGQPEVYRRQEERQSNTDMRRMTGGKTSGGEINYNRPDGGYGNVSYFMHKTDPMGQRDSKERYDQPRQIGFRQQEKDGLDKETVMGWVDDMEDGEGVKGGKYTWHQTQQHAMNIGITGQQRLLEMYWAMNAMYADYHNVAKKYGVDKPDFYAHLAKAFIEDPDAVDDKVEAYVEHIVKHK